MEERYGFYPQNEWAPLKKMFSGECPHCHKAFTGLITRVSLGTDSDGDWAVSGTFCPTPECRRFILYLEEGKASALIAGRAPPQVSFTPLKSRLIRPEFVLPAAIPKDTPPEIAEDYRQASMVLALSPAASAALSRRCLQNIIRERSAQDIEEFKSGKLKDEIEQVIESKSIKDANLNKMLHGVRIIGNFAAHPNKSEITGVIMPVEPDEAEFNLNVIGKLLFHYYIQLPDELKMLDVIDKKQQESKKP